MAAGREREERSMTIERVVDAHVHLWDPAERVYGC